MNCALGPEQLRPYSKSFRDRADLRQLLSERRPAERLGRI